LSLRLRQDTGGKDAGDKTPAASLAWLDLVDKVRKDLWDGRGTLSEGGSGLLNDGVDAHHYRLGCDGFTQ
jgi:hypothetical protein